MDRELPKVTRSLQVTRFPPPFMADTAVHCVVDPPTSPTPSPLKKNPRLRISAVANIFLKLQKHKSNSKSHHIESSSGDAWTYPALAEKGATCDKRVLVEENQLFVCVGAVDVVKLLRAVRG